MFPAVYTLTRNIRFSVAVSCSPIIITDFLNVCKCFRVLNAIWWWFYFAFPWLLIRLIIFSYASWPFVFPHLWIVCLDFLSLVLVGDLLVVGGDGVFLWMLTGSVSNPPTKSFQGSNKFSLFVICIHSWRILNFTWLHWEKFFFIACIFISYFRSFLPLSS